MNNREIRIKKSVPASRQILFTRSINNNTAKSVVMNQIVPATDKKKCSFCGGGRR
jgi:hypothetical protein